MKSPTGTTIATWFALGVVVALLWRTERLLAASMASPQDTSPLTQLPRDTGPGSTVRTANPTLSV